MEMTFQRVGLLIKVPNIHDYGPTDFAETIKEYLDALRRGLRGPIARWIWRFLDRLRGRKA